MPLGIGRHHQHGSEVILDEFVAATGYARTYAIRLLNHPVDLKLTIERPRPPHFGPAVQQALHLAWTAANHICAKRLIPFLPMLVESLERHGHLQLSEECRSQLLSMSPATADRILRSYRKHERHGRSTTRAGTLLKKQIPIRTFQDWNEAKAGFMEADLVAHCGHQTDGSFLYTLTLTDIATGWTEFLPLLKRTQEAVVAALKRVQHLLPFPLLGIDTDIGYDRFAGELAYRQLTELYRALRVSINCFQPSMKLHTKQREGSKVRRTYDRAQTPMQRLLASDAVSPHKQQELLRVTQALDPLRLLRQLEQLQKALFQHAVKPGAASLSQEGSSTLQFSVKRVTSEQVPANGIPGTAPSLLKKERRRRYQRSGRPHDWRTRQDPFEGLWEEITSWLVARPELTAAEIFRELEHLYPGRYRPTQARTLRRGGHSLRARLLVTFDDQWGEEIVTGQSPTPALRAEVVVAVS